MQPIMLVVGTRPEAIKMMPVYFAFKQAHIPVVLCSTGQHNTLLDEVFSLFKVDVDISLSIMRPGQDLAYITCSVLSEMQKVYATVKPLCAMVQGDTTTVMAAALAAFYQKIPIAHVEAGLRTGDLYNPYPEEANRCIVGLLSELHFAPTAGAAAHLLAEGVAREKIFCTGNTVVDALILMQEKITQGLIPLSPELVRLATQKDKKIILLTAHRRESFPHGIRSILKAVKQFAREHQEVVILYPHHPNPIVIDCIKELALKEVTTIYVLPPVPYHELIYLLMKADLILTDSGGIQEEGVSLGKKVLVLREKSERMEGVWEGFAQLVGTSEDAILKALTAFFEIDDALVCQKTSKSAVYGDGKAGQRIVRIMQEHFFKG